MSLWPADGATTACQDSRAKAALAAPGCVEGTVHHQFASTGLRIEAARVSQVASQGTCIEVGPSTIAPPPHRGCQRHICLDASAAASRTHAEPRCAATRYREHAVSQYAKTTHAVAGSASIEAPRVADQFAVQKHIFKISIIIVLFFN
jgi:hypothetical protein